MGITKKELLDYVRLEEDEDTAELLKRSSFLCAGSAVIDGVKLQYWSYPTSCDVAWVSFSSENALRTENEDDVPSTIKSATVPRDKHPMRQASQELARPVDRSPISAPTWVPRKDAPTCHYFPVWKEDISFMTAARAFSARPTCENVGYRCLVFCVRLTSGRYALIDAPEHKQESISISLELEEDAESRKNEACMGFVRVCDIKEILGAMGREHVPPKVHYSYEWRE